MSRTSFVCAFLLASCAAPTAWRAVETDANFETVWRSFVQLAAISGYTLDHAETDEGLKHFVSKWRPQPAPFRMGRRTRLFGEFERSVDGTGWNVRFWIEAQQEKMGAGFEPTEDDWSGAGQDTDRENDLERRLRYSLAPSQPDRAPK